MVITGMLRYFPALWLSITSCLHAGGIVDNTSTGSIPLTEPGAGTDLGTEGGLYPGGENEIPAAHLALGMALAAQVVPRDADGQPDPDGHIGILTTGMSNASMTFGRLGELMSGLWSPQVVFVNGAQGSMDASVWADPDHQAW